MFFCALVSAFNNRCFRSVSIRLSLANRKPVLSVTSQGTSVQEVFLILTFAWLFTGSVQKFQAQPLLNIPHGSKVGKIHNTATLCWVYLRKEGTWERINHLWGQAYKKRKDRLLWVITAWHLPNKAIPVLSMQPSPQNQQDFPDDRYSSPRPVIAPSPGVRWSAMFLWGPKLYRHIARWGPSVASALYSMFPFRLSFNHNFLVQSRLAGMGKGISLVLWLQGAVDFVCKSTNLLMENWK